MRLGYMMQHKDLTYAVDTLVSYFSTCHSFPSSYLLGLRLTSLPAPTRYNDEYTDSPEDSTSE